MKTAKSLMLILCAIFALTLAACGGDEENIASKDYVFRTEELTALTQLFNDNSFQLVPAGDTLYACGSIWDEMTGQQTLIVAKIDENGNVLSSLNYPQDFDSSINANITGTSDGRLFVGKMVYPKYDDPAGGGGGIDIAPLPVVPRISVAEEKPQVVDEEASFQTEQYYLVELAPDGQEKRVARFNENEYLNYMEWFYVNQLWGLPDNTILVNAGERYAIYGTDGAVLSGFNPADSIDLSNGWGANFVVTADNRCIFYQPYDRGVRFWEYNVAANAYGEEIVFENTGNAYYNVYPGAGYDIFMADDRDLYGYNLGGELVRIMNYADSDLFIYGINSIYGQSADSFIASTYDAMEGRNFTARFIKVPPEEVADRIEIVLAGSYIDWNIRGQAVQFNKGSDRYRITFMDYGNTYNTSDDWTAGVTRLNSDIASGRVPDILMVTNDLPIKSYMAKGLFADILSFVDNDEELDRADLMPNIVEAFSMDGKMYQLVPHYSILTGFARTSIVGDRSGWTIGEALDLLAAQPMGTQLLDSFTTRNTVLYYAMLFGGNEFVDWENGRCHFDSEGFKELLVLAKSYPDEIDYSVYDQRPEYWSEQEAQYRTGKTLLLISNFGSPRDYNRVKKGMFGADVTMVGFPTGSGTGAVIQTYMSMTISEKSKVKDGAWEFLRYFLTEEYQDSQSNWNMPISRKAYDKMAQEAMGRPYYIDYMTGEKIEYDEEYYIDGNVITLEPLTADENAALLQYLQTVNTTGEYNETLINIINEEVEPYFNNQKTVEEVVAIIQSRAQIYISENG